MQHGARQLLRLSSLRATNELASLLARTSQGGDLIALHGGLGVGKTAFARFFISSYYGDSTLSVTSPTYVIEIPYEPSPEQSDKERIRHIDLFRLQETADVGTVRHLNGEEDKDILLIEWPKNCPSLKRINSLEVHLGRQDEDSDVRIAELIGHGDWSRRLALVSKELDNIA